MIALRHGMDLWSLPRVLPLVFFFFHSFFVFLFVYFLVFCFCLQTSNKHIMNDDAINPNLSSQYLCWVDYNKVRPRSVPTNPSETTERRLEKCFRSGKNVCSFYTYPNDSSEEVMFEDQWRISKTRRLWDFGWNG